MISYTDRKRLEELRFKEDARVRREGDHRVRKAVAIRDIEVTKAFGELACMECLRQHERLSEFLGRYPEDRDEFIRETMERQSNAKADIIMNNWGNAHFQSLCGGDIGQQYKELGMGSMEYLPICNECYNTENTIVKEKVRFK